ncbi:class I SAM-dependent methyltransferase [Corallococcus sp. RDP092CA]|uniref:class I SAM-dependent methyltransferase n=1 Tax=Corallococcus sp. RDP092CA TaxID=3109369 RepID=UPI0035B1BD02
MQLSALEETAWLTIYCQSVAGERYALNKAFADWMLEQVGKPSFAEGLAWRTVDGVALRSSLLDGLIEEELRRLQATGERVSYWSLGAGFDYRWDRFHAYLGSTIHEYLEFDQPALLESKARLLQDSPFRQKYQQVRQHPGNLVHGLPDSLPATSGPVLVVLEGVIDYLGREDKLRLLGAIKARAPRAVVVMDAMNRWAVDMNNRKSSEATGSKKVGFSWAPESVEDFYRAEAGYQVLALRSLFRELLVRKNRLLRLLPLPARIDKCSCLLKLSAS